jgi:hypothetical protein
VSGRSWLQNGLTSLILAVWLLTIVTCQAKERPVETVEMTNYQLTCELDLIPRQSEVGLGFNLQNVADKPITFRYFMPFADFELKAFTDEDQPIPIIQPAYDTGVQPVSVTVAAGETIRIETPIRLQFDPNMAPAGGDDPTLWTLQHAPTPVRLQVTMHLGELEVAPCETRWEP